MDTSAGLPTLGAMNPCTRHVRWIEMDSLKALLTERNAACPIQCGGRWIPRLACLRCRVHWSSPAGASRYHSSRSVSLARARIEMKIKSFCCRDSNWKSEMRIVVGRNLRLDCDRIEPREPAMRKSTEGRVSGCPSRIAHPNRKGRPVLPEGGHGGSLRKLNVAPT